MSQRLDNMKQALARYREGRERYRQQFGPTLTDTVASVATEAVNGTVEAVKKPLGRAQEGFTTLKERASKRAVELQEASQVKRQERYDKMVATGEALGRKAGEVSDAIGQGIDKVKGFATATWGKAQSFSMDLSQQWEEHKSKEKTPLFERLKNRAQNVLDVAKEKLNHAATSMVEKYVLPYYVNQTGKHVAGMQDMPNEPKLEGATDKPAYENLVEEERRRREAEFAAFYMQNRKDADSLKRIQDIQNVEAKGPKVTNQSLARSAAWSTFWSSIKGDAPIPADIANKVIDQVDQLAHLEEQAQNLKEEENIQRAQLEEQLTPLKNARQEVQDEVDKASKELNYVSPHGSTAEAYRQFVEAEVKYSQALLNDAKERGASAEEISKLESNLSLSQNELADLNNPSLGSVSIAQEGLRQDDQKEINDATVSAEVSNQSTADYEASTFDPRDTNTGPAPFIAENIEPKGLIDLNSLTPLAAAQVRLFAQDYSNLNDKGKKELVDSIVSQDYDPENGARRVDLFQVAKDIDNGNSQSYDVGKYSQKELEHQVEREQVRHEFKTTKATQEPLMDSPDFVKNAEIARFATEYMNANLHEREELRNQVLDMEKAPYDLMPYDYYEVTQVIDTEHLSAQDIADRYGISGNKAPEQWEEQINEVITTDRQLSDLKDDIMLDVGGPSEDFASLYDAVPPLTDDDLAGLDNGYGYEL